MYHNKIDKGLTDISLPPENVFGHSKKLKLIISSIKQLKKEKKRDLKILDIGCGNGSAVTRFLAMNGDCVLGIDTHKPSIDFAQKKYANNNLQFKNTSAESVVGKEGLYDVIVFADILEHVSDPENLLKLAVSMIEESGIIIVTIPNGYGPFEIESYISRMPILGEITIKITDLIVASMNKYIFKDKWTHVQDNNDVPYNADSPHIQFFTGNRIKELISNANLIVDRQNNLSWFSGPYTNYFLSPSNIFCKINTKIADHLPAFMVSAWFFKLVKIKDGN